MSALPRFLEECGRKSTLGQLAGLNVAIKVHEGFRRCYSGLSAAPASNDPVVVTPDTLPILADVCQHSRLLLFEHRSDIHIGVGQKTLRLRASINLKEIEVWTLLQGHACLDREDAGHLVIHVSVHRPMRK